MSLKISLAASLFPLMLAYDAAAQNSSAAALELLDRVGAKYRDAEYLHIEAAERRTSHNDHFHDAHTSISTIYIAPGGRLRYAGEDASGSSLLVSDGTDEWRLMNSFLEFAKSPSGTFFASRALYGSDNTSLFAARDVIAALRNLGSNVHAAHFAGTETLVLNGKPTECTVLVYTDKDAAQQRGTHFDWQMKVAIDPQTLSIAKTEQHATSQFVFGNAPPPHGPSSDTSTVTTFSVVDFNFEPKPETFQFSAPAGTREVASLPTGFSGSPPPAGPTPDHQAALDHVGKPLPDVFVLDEIGKETPLRSFFGHPFLISVWATWCGPCLSEMPLLNRVRKETANSDLKIIGVDEDLHSADARDLLKRRGYSWPDYTYTVAFSRALSMTGLPLTLVVDASGTVVYYHTGADDPKGLVSAINGLGPQYQISKSE